ncbi:hypothetical protein DDZ18_07245 [Marinicauda salina]|uniref:Uncharacterized protein n=1 Tax=Marinicauda salina TaxID=2135793 RepID=A0A2U2BTX1_9PROT|nr:hypothetical protein DDZ18_07245 [Marinicauda salina]
MSKSNSSTNALGCEEHFRRWDEKGEEFVRIALARGDMRGRKAQCARAWLEQRQQAVQEGAQPVWHETGWGKILVNVASNALSHAVVGGSMLLLGVLIGLAF